jgi:hypothetical protein
VVVGTHGRTGLARLTLDSTAEAVIQSAPCSVLIVRLQQAGDDFFAGVEYEREGLLLTVLYEL